MGFGGGGGGGGIYITQKACYYRADPTLFLLYSLLQFRREVMHGN